MPNLYQCISISQDLPESNLKAGDVAWLIDVVPHPEGGEEGYVLEIYNALGESIRVVTVPASVVASLHVD